MAGQIVIKRAEFHELTLGTAHWARRQAFLLHAPSTLFDGAVLEIETQHHWYTIVNGSGGHALISGHPNYCPEPVPVRIAGSTWGGSMLKLRYIGRGMHLEFCHPTNHTITTSRVVDIRTAAS